MRLLPALLISAALPGAAWAQCPGDDGFNNNTFVGAEQIPQGQTSITDRAILGIWNGTPSPAIDCFRFDVGPGATAEFEALYDFSEVGLYLQRIDLNFATVQGTNPNTGTAILSYTNTSSVTESFYLVVVAGLMPSGCAEYGLECLIDPCPGDDDLEDNDSCQSTFPLVNVPSMELRRLAVLDGDDDWFDIELRNGERLDASIFFEHARADLDLWLYDANDCGGNALTSSRSTTDDEMVTYTNDTGSTQTIAVWAEFWSGSGGNLCNTYDLEWEVMNTLPDDIFEENDTITSSVPIDIGVYPELLVRDGDSDFYSFSTSFENAVIAVNFEHNDGDIDLRLWRTDATGTNLVESSTSTSDIEEIYIVPNTSQEFWIAEVYYFPSDGGDNTYELTFGKSRAEIDGHYVCEAEPNATYSQGSQMDSNGNYSVANNSFSLSAGFVTSNSFSYFLCSKGYGFVQNPGGSQGNLCITGAPIGRFTGPGQIQNSGTFGEVGLFIDLTDMPQPQGAVAVVPGETWFFQLWHRDADSSGGPSSNFSNALRIRFEP